MEYPGILIGHSQKLSSSAGLLAVCDKSWAMVGCQQWERVHMWNVFQNWSEDATAGLWPPPGLGSHLQGLIFPTFLFCYWKSALSDLHWGTAKWLGQVWCGGGICSIWQGITLSSTAVGWAEVADASFGNGTVSQVKGTRMSLGHIWKFLTFDPAEREPGAKLDPLRLHLSHHHPHPQPGQPQPHPDQASLQLLLHQLLLL